MELYIQMKQEAKVISLQLPLDMYIKLKSIAEENEQPVQGLVRSLIKQYLRSSNINERVEK